MQIELNDAGLARQIASGNDRNAETELFRRLAQRVWLYSLRHLQDERATDDLTKQLQTATLSYKVGVGRAAGSTRVLWLCSPPGVEMGLKIEEALSARQKAGRMSR